MKIGISNIAWDVGLDQTVAQTLQSLGCTSIDLAPTKYIPHWEDMSRGVLDGIRKFWNDRGFAIEGMQSLLFGTQGLNLFGTSDERQRMLAHLHRVCEVAHTLGAKQLVFGSPLNRDRSAISSQILVDEIATEFLFQMAQIARSHGVIFCLEPNPQAYRCNFIETTAEAANWVTRIQHANLRMQLDTGTIIMNREDITKILPVLADRVGHIHVSNPDLAPLTQLELEHALLGTHLRQCFPNYRVTIEMRAIATDLQLDSIKNSYLFTQRHYG